MAFVAPETGLKINRFSGLPGGTPEFRTRTSGRVTGLFQEAVEDQKTIYWMTEGYASQPGGPKGPADLRKLGHEFHLGQKT